MAGWAGKVDERRMYVDVMAGVGGVLGGWLFGQLGIEWGGVLGQLGTAIVGAVAILWIASLIKK